MATLAEEFNPRQNSIGLLRLVSASMVIVGHAVSFGGYGDDFLKILTHNQLAIGRWPVDVFFVLSGFLLVSSFERAPLLDYARNRALRIYPGFWVCLFVGGILVPLMFNLPPNLRYVRDGLLLVTGVPFTIPGLFTENVEHSVNSALWTLPIELWCYISIPLASAFGLLNRRRLPVVFVLIVLCFWTVIIRHPEESNSAITSPLRLFSFFYGGVLLQIFKNEVQVSLKYAFVALAVLGAATLASTIWFHHSGGLFYVLAPFLLSYVVMVAAVRLPFTRINTKTDLSYGIYIYGTLILQILAAKGLAAPTLSYISYLAAAGVLTFVVAFMSWHLVEKPALQQKRLASKKLLATGLVK